MKQMYLLPFLLLFVLFSCEEEQLHYDVVIENGSGSGNYRLGETVSFQAAPPTGRQAFDQWKGDVAVLSRIDSAAGSFEMPLQDVYLEATYKTIPYFLLAVSGGSGSGEYPEKERVQIKADDAPAGYGFLKWEGDTTCLDNPSAASTYLSMPAQDVQLQASFHPTVKFQLAVFDGLGDGLYFVDTEIEIKAHLENSIKEFTHWSGDTLYLEDTKEAVTTLSMPAKDISVTANYVDVASTVSFANDIYPIIQTRCSYAGCHRFGEQLPWLTDYTAISAEGDAIRTSLLIGRMPIGPMPQEEIDKVVEWINAGTPNN